MSDFGRSDFVAGFSARHAAPVQALAAIFAATTDGFAAAPIGPTPPPRPARATQAGPVSFSPQGPRHFSPADPSTNPTEGWNPLEAGNAGGVPDPLLAAHAAGYEEGVTAALAAQQAEILAAAEANARDRALIAALADELASGRRIDREMIAGRLRDTVLMLVSQLVGEIGVSPDRFATRIEAACDLLADTSESAMLRVHPDDVALLEGRLPKNVFTVGDASVARGSFLMESASTIVEDGPEMWLDQLAEAIERVPVPQGDDRQC